MRAHINVSSKHVVWIKIRNTPTFFVHFVMQVMHKIFMTGDLSPQQITYSIVSSLNDVPRNNMKHP